MPTNLWAKAGVICCDLIKSNYNIKTLFKEEYEFQKMPQLESKMWMTRRDFLSPKWTTDWNDIPKLS
jgi:hypothetical protein